MQKSKSAVVSSRYWHSKVSGIQIDRYFTKGMQDPYQGIHFEQREIEPKNHDVSPRVEVPTTWSQQAVEILAHYYLRKSGVPKQRRETSVKQAIYRIAHTLRVEGEKLGGYFRTSQDAKNFEDEFTRLAITQAAVLSSPAWFNLGLYQCYGIEGSRGYYFWNPKTDQIEACQNAYQHPQCAATFIQSVEDDFIDIFELAKNEAKVFKYGSGTGTNFSTIRGAKEEISGGGNPSGLKKYLDILDRGAAAAKAGGITRRAAKMACLDIDHPEITEFIEWKAREEDKAHTLIQAGYSADFTGDAYQTIGGQNANNSVRLSDEFMTALLEDKEWKTFCRTTGKVYEIHRARELFQKIAYATWFCAEPGIHFDTTINRWNTCKLSGDIHATNSCSEFMFLDDTACYLASLNLEKFINQDGKWDIEGYRQAVLILMIAMDIMVDLCSYPSYKIAKNTHHFRPLGLGFANLGAVLMQQGIPYDSDAGRNTASALTGLLTACAYGISTEIAETKGAFLGYFENQAAMQEVIKKHQDCLHNIHPNYCNEEILKAAHTQMRKTIHRGKQYGYRNAQTTLIAPTGTIGLLMDCDTTGIEPDFALVKLKKLVNGSLFKMVNKEVPRALKKLGYSNEEVKNILHYALGSLTFKGAPHINDQSLMAKGFTKEDLAHQEKALQHALSLRSVFSYHHTNHALLKRLGFRSENYRRPDFDLLLELGFTEKEIKEAGDYICGMHTLEGAPHLKKEHLPIFDCANRSGVYGKRYLRPLSHVLMLSAVQPYISGCISKTINLPEEASIEDVEGIILDAWKKGLKAVAIYRDQCKLSQPLNTRSLKKRLKVDPVVDRFRDYIRFGSILDQTKHTPNLEVSKNDKK